jgi:K+-sensing histidine kinase KdpD
MGSSSADSQEERRRLFLTNGLALVTCVPPVLYGLLFAVLGFYYLILLNTVFAGLFLLTLLLNKCQKRYLAKFCLIGTLCLAIFAYSLILGMASGIYLVTFAVSCIALVLFSTHDYIGRIISLGIPVLTVIAIFYLEHFSFFRINSFQEYAGLVFVLSVLTTFAIIFFVLRFFMRLNDAYTLEIVEINEQLSTQNTALQTAYTELQAQQNLLEKTWQEYGFTSKLSGTLRLSEIVDLTAKTILQHFDLRYVATVSSGDTSTLETWVLDNGLPIRTRQDIFESQICYTYEKGPILNLSAAQLSSNVLDILDPIPGSVLHLAITESESRYILIGPKKSGFVFSDSDLKLLQALSTQAITALQRALPYEDAVHRYGLAIKQESAYQMLVSLQHQINSPLSAAKMAMDTLSKTQVEDKTSVIAKMGKEALDSVVAVMRRMRQISQLRETTYLGDIKMWDIEDEPIAVTKP